MDQDIKIPVAAGEDLSGAQYAAIEIDGTVAATHIVAKGVLQNKPQSGEAATLTCMGRSKFRAGGTIAVANRLTVTTSGFFVAATASGDQGIGFALGAVASGGIAEGFFNFANVSIIA
jgi:hypothetical protein